MTPARVEGAGRAARVRPPMEVVLPPLAYGALLVEVVLLVALELRFGTRPTAASERIGQAVGWIGTASMVLMHVYSIRRRVRSLSRWGRLSRWLQLHIFLGLQGVLFVTFHSMHLATLRNLSGATFAMTLVVVASGMFGRYLFSMLPKGIAGERLESAEAQAELSELVPLVDELLPALGGGGAQATRLRAALDELSRPLPAPQQLTVGALFAADRAARRALRSLDAALAEARRGAPATEALERAAAAARRVSVLRRRLVTLASAERVFRGWIVMHRPLTFILFGTVFLHVLGHYLFAAAYSA